MKISLEWLTDFLPGALDPHAAGDALTHGGLPVEHFEKHGDDDVIDVEVTSNRGDCLSHLGVARELAALLDRPFNDPKHELSEVGDPASASVTVRIDAPALCPNYTARVVRNVEVGPSPDWLVRRLAAVGVRSINNVVDVTNYVMFELGQPLHAFDLDKIEGRRITVRTAAAGEKLTTLDGREHPLAADMLVIADDRGPVALAGIMGGLHSEVTGSTTNVLLESARFDPLVVRKTARALAMKSESSYRFERGLPQALQSTASTRAASLLKELANGNVAPGAVQAGARNPSPPRLRLRRSTLKRVLGIDVAPSDVLGALQRLGFTTQLTTDAFDVEVPTWRLDVTQEIDLVEEVARLVGYDKIPMRPEISVRLNPADPALAATLKIRQTLIAAGYFEAITMSFVSDALANDFRPPEAATLPRAYEAVRKADAHLRPSLLPGLLEAVRHNENAGTLGAKLFEIGSAFWADGTGEIRERRRVGLVGSADVREVRGAVEELLARLDASRPVTVVPDARPGLTAGGCGRVEWGNQTVGYLGKVDRSVIEKLSLREVPCAAELDVELLLAGAQPTPTLKPLAKFPAVQRDLSLVVTEDVRYEQLDTLVRTLKPAQLEGVEFVTTYRGKPLTKGQKSVTLKLVFRAADRTLTGDEVEDAVKKITDAAATQLKASLRA